MAPSRWLQFYIRHFDARGRPNLPNCDDSLSKSLWLEYGWRDRTVDTEQLFDLMFDPNETRNVAADPTQSAALTEMRGRLDRWMRSTNDPILHGPIVAPKGATANDPDGVSPRETPKLL